MNTDKLMELERKWREQADSAMRNSGTWSGDQMANRVAYMADELAAALRAEQAKPLAMWCPKCEMPHVDEGEWETRLHKTHQCQGCGHEWRPFDYPTVGVPHIRSAEQAVGDEQRAWNILAESLDMPIEIVGRYEDLPIDGAIRAIRRALGTARQSEGVWTDAQCAAFMSVAMRHCRIKGEFTWDDIRLGQRRAAMLAAAPGGEGDATNKGKGCIDCGGTGKGLDVGYYEPGPCPSCATPTNDASGEGEG